MQLPSFSMPLNGPLRFRMPLLIDGVALRDVAHAHPSTSERYIGMLSYTRYYIMLPQSTAPPCNEYP